MSNVCPTPGKVRFTSRAQALTDSKRAEQLGAQGKGRRRAYMCPCGFWHVTHLSKREFKRLTRPLDGGLGERCGTRPATQVHHRTYERLGFEKLSDLTPLCRACHEAEHDIKPEPGPGE